MNMIEVDPKLFITCRLCVEETGVYQIVPEVQKKIKYCFDLEISLLDGLPPLICKKCESMLSHHAQVKEMVHEKQRTLIKKFKKNPIKENITEETADQVPTIQQIDVQKIDDKNNDKDNINEEISLKSKKCKLKNHVNSSFDRNSPHVNNTELVIIKKANKSANNEWRRNYKRQFVCRFCSISLRHKKSMICHGERCAIMKKYAHDYKWCWVQVNTINSKCNLTESNNHVVYEKNKIVNTKNPNYYVIYSLKPEIKKNSSESSDENFTRNKRKRKRQRLISESSNDTFVIDVFDKENNKSMFTAQSDIECVTLVDSDTESTLNMVTEKPENLKTLTNEKMVNNIVSICYKKYLKRCNVGGNYGKNTSNNDSFLQRKLLSIGRKIIHKEGFNQIGLLRYMEQKHLDVIWMPKLEANVSVRTTLKENDHNDNDLSLKSLSLIESDYKSRDFVDIFEQNSISEADSTNSNDNIQDQVGNNEKKCVISNNSTESSTNYFACNTNTELAQNTDVMETGKILSTYENLSKNNVLYINDNKDTTNVSNIKKILNLNPVANPKKLTKKVVSEFTTNSNNYDEATIVYTTATDNSRVIDKCLRLPIITSTVSLAPPAQNVKSLEASPSCNEAASKISEIPLPRIKVKPVSELMAAASDKPKGALVTASVWAGNSNETQPQFLPNMVPNLLLTPSPMYVNLVQPSSITFHQYQNSQINNFNQVNPNSDPSTCTRVSPQVNDSRELITMHTVELPRKKTHSPFLYFKELLQIHNMNLIDNAEPTTNMCCIIKFKLRFEQKGIAPVTLCLSLYCHKNTFCIQVKDLQSRVLNVYDFSAYWQWEVLKGLKGDVITMMLQNAKKYDTDIFERTTYFVSLLSNITVTTD